MILVFPAARLLRSGRLGLILAFPAAKLPQSGRLGLQPPTDPSGPNQNRQMDFICFTKTDTATGDEFRKIIPKNCHPEMFQNFANADAGLVQIQDQPITFSQHSYCRHCGATAERTDYCQAEKLCVPNSCRPPTDSALQNDPLRYASPLEATTLAAAAL